MYMYVCKSVLNVNLHTYAYPYITSEFKLGKKRKNLFGREASLDLRWRARNTEVLR